jgi:hypothetical protein
MSQSAQESGREPALDWTESPLLAAFFAVSQWMESGLSETSYQSPDMVVWMLHPGELNRLSGANGFPNTWTPMNVGAETFRLAFHAPDELRIVPIDDPDASRMVPDPAIHILPSRYPLAVQASAVDRRVVVQRSCFTIHGADKRALEIILSETPLVAAGYLQKFTIPRQCAPGVFRDLVDMGISFSTTYPDFAGLAKELKWRFGPQP